MTDPKVEEIRARRAAGTRIRLVDIDYLLARLDGAEKEMHSRELHHFESEELLEAAEAPARALVIEITKVIEDLDRARANGTVYTYGNIQTRLRHALSRVLPRGSGGG